MAMMTRLGLVVGLLAGCTKQAPPPQPPAEEPPPPEATEESTEDQPEVTIDRSTHIEGPLTQEQVEAVVQENFTDIQHCFDAALVRMEADDLTGGIAVRIEVDGDGSVTQASLEASNFGDEETPECIVGEVEGWSFPKSKKGEPSTVVHPFFLRSY